MLMTSLTEWGEFEVNRNSLHRRKEVAVYSNVDYHSALRGFYDIFRELQVIVSWTERFLRLRRSHQWCAFVRLKTLKTIWFVLNCQGKNKQSWGCLNAEKGEYKIW